MNLGSELSPGVSARTTHVASKIIQQSHNDEPGNSPTSNQVFWLLHPSPWVDLTPFSVDLIRQDYETGELYARWRDYPKHTRTNSDGNNPLWVAHKVQRKNIDTAYTGTLNLARDTAKTTSRLMASIDAAYERYYYNTPQHPEVAPDPGGEEISWSDLKLRSQLNTQHIIKLNVETMPLALGVGYNHTTDKDIMAYHVRSTFPTYESSIINSSYTNSVYGLASIAAREQLFIDGGLNFVRTSSLKDALYPFAKLVYKPKVNLGKLTETALRASYGKTGSEVFPTDLRLGQVPSSQVPVSIPGNPGALVYY